MCDCRFVFEVSEALEGVCEWEDPARRYLGDGVRAGTGACAAGSELRHDATAERELAPLW